MSQFYADYPVSGGGVTSLNGLTGALTLVGAGGITITPNSPSLGDITITGTGGTVTSVGFADGSTVPIFGISGSPVTVSGTITETLLTQTANRVFAGPTIGSPAQPTFRALVSADIPSLSALYANVTLSNLTSPTSINQDLIFNTGHPATLKTQDDLTPSGLSKSLAITTGNAGNVPGGLSLTTGTATTSGFTADITIQTGDSPDNTSGNIVLMPGAAGTTRGTIQFQDGTEGTSGQIWTSTDTIGSGSWQPKPTGTVSSVAFTDGSTSPIFTITGSPVTSSGTITETLITQSANTVFAGPTSGGVTQPTFRALVATDIPSLSSLYATVTLNNLTSPTSVNQSLIPSNDGGHDLGSIVDRWGNLFAVLARDSSNVVTIEIDNRKLDDSSGNISLDWNTRNLQDSTQTPQLSWSTTGITINKALILDGSSSGAITIQAAATTTPYTITMPSAQGTGALTNNGSGVLSWTPSTANTNNKELFTLSSGDITNQFIDLAHVAKTNSIFFLVQGGGIQIEGVSFDYSVNYTGGAGGNTRITFLNGLATGGASALVAGDVVVAQYEF